MVEEPMEYTALYRKWRPQTLDEVVGQDHVIQILKNQIKSRMVSHAYLFSGPRGTGKTSTAKIFAKAINCTESIDGNPCGECKICTKIDSESNIDILEIDAASNTGVDHIREIRDKVKYPPSIGRYKVYIIDEIHMLSISAFNAFLKTLEEPPDHIVFVLATTEPHKLPSTVLSRCQRYDFRRITTGAIVNRLREIADHMKIQVQDKALGIIARWSEGGMRDSISLLDQCISFCGSNIREEDVLAILGTASSEFFFDVVDNIIKGNMQGIFLQIEYLIEEGRDIQVFLKDLIDHLRNLLIAEICQEPSNLLDVSENTLKRYKDQAIRAKGSRLIRAIEILTRVDAEIKWSTKPRIILEMAMVKICRPQDGDSLEDLKDRVNALEDLVKNKDFKEASKEPIVGSKLDETSRQITKKRIETPRPKETTSLKSEDKEIGDITGQDDKRPITTPKGGDSKKIEKMWPEILKIIRRDRMAIYTLLRETRLKIGGKNKKRANLIFPSHQGFYMAAIEKEENIKYIEGLILEASGQELAVKCYAEDSAPGFSGEEADIKKIEPPREEDSKENTQEVPDIIKKTIDIFGEEYVEIIED